MTVDTECFKHRDKLKELRIAHRSLDEMIVAMSEDPSVDQLHLRRLKRRKLCLKDNILRLESELIPDLNA
ncbi:MAG: YdcH family protein [Gammaproteobacteria bacterium]|nr:YdcH family protein [Gammaproteobacteria bacterium]